VIDRRFCFKIYIFGALSVRCNRVYLDAGLGSRDGCRERVTEILLAEFNWRLC
jgi:hypothetical protein